MIVSGKPLRDYQQKAVNNIFGEWNRGIRRTMICIPTGSGKTQVASNVAKMLDSGQKMLWLCHREELAYQAQRALREATGRIVDLEMGDFRAAHRDASIVVAMVQSIQGKRRRRYGPDRFQVGVIDECFPAGTLVDGRPIETIKQGDMVDSFNHETKQIEKRKVLRVSRRVPSQLSIVMLENDQTFVCTPEHPFYVRNTRLPIRANHQEERYWPARELTSFDEVLKRDGTWHRIRYVGDVSESVGGTFSGNCPDKFVYNMEVEGNHNYFVDGYLVHNCHHATAKTYMATIDYFTGINRWLGLTATPKRSDGVALGKVFESVAYHMEVSTAVDLGWLVAPKQRIASCRDIDLRNVDTVAGDFHKAQLKAQLMKQQVVDQIARKSIAVADGRQTIVFCQTVDQAHALSRVFTLLGEKSVSICGKTPSGIRKDRVDRFRSGSARFLCQVNICTEGFDVPECEVVSMARPTKSQPVFAQAVGRGLRPLNPPQGLTPSERRKEIQTSTKPHATVLDFYGNTGRHKLCNTGDLLGGEYDDEVRAMAVRKAQEIDQDIDMIALLEQCKEEIARLPQAARAGSSQETEQDKLYKLFAHALMRYEPHPCDALGIDPKVPQAAVDKEDTYGGSMSRSVKCCENHRLTATEIGKMSQYQVVYVARVLEDRESRGLCTYPQLRFLYKHGYPPNLTIPQASQKIARIKANKGRRPSEDGPNEILRRLVDRLSVPRR